MKLARHRYRRNCPLRSAGLSLAGLIGPALTAAVQLASPFTSHLVLQRDETVPVWGTAAAGEMVTVEFAGQKKSTTANPEGKWQVELAPLSAAEEGKSLLVTGTQTTAPLRMDDVLVGEVWLCSGQSNMDFTVAKTEKYYFAGVDNEAAEVAAADFPQIRMFTGQWQKSSEPAARVPGEWKICTPENVREFSAIGYFFARDLQRALHVPVGIVTLTFGASTAQAWIRREAITANARLRPVLDAFDAKVRAYTPSSPAVIASWQAAAAAAKAEGRRAPRRPNPDPVQDQHNPTVMFNGMIAPFIPFAVRGVLWYQGESITAPKELFPVWNETLIRDWRKLWGRDLPFYFCQLAALDNNSNNPAVRAQQAEALKIPGTAMAVTIDIGDKSNVHPKNKQDVGDRLCRIALAKTYGREVEYSGPELQNAKREGATIILDFSHTTGGLVAKGGELEQFEISSGDEKFVPAEARINGNSVMVSSPQVAAPKFVRYAWSNYPAHCNFYNGVGLPAAPFSVEVPLIEAASQIAPKL